MDKESKIKHYWDCASALEPETHTHKLLKSYYMTTCRKLAKSSIQMPQEKFSRSTMCRRCSSKWNESDFRMKLKPQEIANSSKTKKQIAKLYESKQSIEQRRSLTRKQRKRAKWLLKRVRNSMEMQCEFCQHKTTIGMHKTSKNEREVSKAETRVVDKQKQISSEAAACEAVKLKKKKKKTKDKNAGIKVEKVQTVLVNKLMPKVKAPDIITDLVEHKTAKQKVTKLQDEGSALKIKPKAIKKNVEKTDVSNKPAKPALNLSQPLKAKKKKKKTAATSNLQSKTQQQNSLLQLAALLKTQTANKSGAKVAQNRLESLLK